MRAVDGINPDQILKIPVSYAPKDKMLAIIKSDPTIQRKFAVELPTMSFEYTGFEYDPQRKLNTLGKTVVISTTANTRTLSYQYNPVPYNFNFNLYVYTKDVQDASKIVEQIIPFFTPDWTPTVILVPQLNITMDIPIILKSVQLTDTYEGDFITRQAFVYTLAFTLKGYLFGPIKEQPVIKFANTTFYIVDPANMFANTALPDGSNTVFGDAVLMGLADGILPIEDAVGITKPSDRVTIQPGQLANGQPTSNLTLTIPYDNIVAGSDFGYCINIYGDIPEEI